MRKHAVIAVVAFLSFAAWSQSEDPNDMFGGSTVTEAPTASATSRDLGPERLLQSGGIEIGGTLFSDFTSYAFWPDAYPRTSDPGSGLSTSFVPNLEGDLYFDARPYTYFRVFGKLKAIYPFGSAAQDVSAAQVNPLGTIYEPPAASAASFPNISVFELFADVNWNEALFLRVGQQVIHWGVGRFFSPADILSLTPINPLQPMLERQGPLALSVTVPFARTDNAYLYVIANQAFASNGTLRPNDLAVAPKVEVLLGSYEVGLGGYYQRNQRPRAMTTVSGSLFGLLGVFGEGVVSYGSDRVLVGASGPYTDTTTPYFSGTVGTSYVEGQQHIAAFVQYYYNGQGYSDLASERAAGALFQAQQAAILAGSTPGGPLLSPSDLLLPGRHYLAASVAWTDIRASNVDLGLFYEGNLSDGSGVVSPFASWTPFPYATLTVAPYVAYGAGGSEFVNRFGYFALSLKVTVGEGEL